MYPRYISSFPVWRTGVRSEEATSVQGGLTLLDLLNAYHQHPLFDHDACRALAGLDEMISLYYALDMTRAVRALHEHGILHGDLKLDNFLLRFAEEDEDIDAEDKTIHVCGGGDLDLYLEKNGITLIDFGRAIDLHCFSSPVQRSSVQFLQDDNPRCIANSSTSPVADCPSQRAGKPWSYDLDYAGLAGCFHMLLHHAPITYQDGDPVLPKTLPLRRYWQCDLWTNIFKQLLDPMNATGTCVLATIESSIRQVLVDKRHKFRAALRRHEIFLLEHLS